MDYRILVADDEPGIRMLLGDLLGQQYSVLETDRGDQVLDIIRRERIDIVLLDLQLPGMNGLQILQRIYDEKLQVAVVIVTASSDLDTAITSMRLGAYDYVVKPFDTERILLTIKNISEKIDLEHEVVELREQVAANLRFKSYIGASEGMQHVFNTLDRVIDTDSTILVIGESGTGKGVLAKAIHYNSNRKSGPFKSVDCSVIPQDLIESELFGHEKGAFTGAVSRKIGKFEAAHEGSLFLDEIANLSAEVQAKLLKVIQEKEFERVGGNQLVSVDVRIIAASNRDLKEMVRQGQFREDLYYRLNVVPVFLPLLRDRQEDIPLLVDFFLERFNREYSRNIVINLDARLFLTRYSWPGNVRQLENVIRRIVLLTTHRVVGLDEVQSIIRFEEAGLIVTPVIDRSGNAESGFSFEVNGRFKTMDMIEKESIEAALRYCGNNISRAAQTLDVSRKTMHNKMKRYGLCIERDLADSGR